MMLKCSRCGNDIGDFVIPPIICRECSGMGYDVMTGNQCDECGGNGIIDIDSESMCKSCYIHEQNDLKMDSIDQIINDYMDGVK